MRRTVGIMFAVALAFVLGCGVVAAGSSQSPALYGGKSNNTEGRP